MIVRMKEISLFTLSSQIDETLLKLGSLGAMDVKQIKPPEGEEVERWSEAVSRTKQAIGILERNGKDKNANPDRKRYNFHDPRRLTERLLTSLKIQLQVRERLGQLKQQRAWYRTWGEQVHVKDLEFLQEKGIFVRLYRIEKSVLSSIPKELPVVAFAEKEGKVPVALFTTEPAAKLPFTEEKWPELPLDVIEREVAKKERQLEEVEHYWSDQAEQLPVLRDYLELLSDRLNLEEVEGSMGNVEGKIRYLRGYLPKDAVDEFKEVAKQNQWGYQIKQPERPEEVPVYIRNPKWIRIIDPVMKFIGIVPGYQELDVSIFFLIAFALFFAMLVGDAGYGFLFLIITLLLRKKLPSEVRLLFYVLSGATIVWGVLSGTYFGSEEIAALPFLNDLIIEEIASFGTDNVPFMMHLSFLIGAIHLTVAHSIRAIRLINSTRALSEIGWIALIWGLFFVVERLVLNRTLPDWNLWLFVGGALLVTLFSRESKNLVQSMLISIANLPLSLINGFSDIVSYVRLFAVGLATAAVAASFNNMMLPAGADLSFLELIAAALALALGHGLNIVLALMAVMVHGIRLNMLEFAGHLGVQFSGEAYQPFRLKALGQERPPLPAEQEEEKIQTKHNS